MANTASIATYLQPGKIELLRGLLKKFLDIDRPEHHSTDCLKKDWWRKEAANNLS